MADRSDPATQEQNQNEIEAALAGVPSGVFVLTARHEDRRSGMLVNWVHQVSSDPPMVSVAVAKGQPIMPLISESRQFGLCQLGEDDRMLRRKFSVEQDTAEDPFLGFDLEPGVLSGVPLLKQSMGFLECELACHIDVEGDHDIFVGRVCSASIADDALPMIHLPANAN